MATGCKLCFLWVDKDRFSSHKRGFWDENLKFLNGVKSDWPTFPDGGIPLPENIQEMVEASEKLAEGFPFARIDWYNIDGKITFGEITFYPRSGYVRYTPDSFDFDLGKFLELISINLLRIIFKIMLIMDLNDFIKNFADQFDDTDASEITADTEYQELDEWSSLTAMSIIALAKTEYGKTITGREIRNAKTVKDLFDLISSK